MQRVCSRVGLLVALAVTGQECSSDPAVMPDAGASGVSGSAAGGSNAAGNAGGSEAAGADTGRGAGASAAGTRGPTGGSMNVAGAEPTNAGTGGRGGSNTAGASRAGSGGATSPRPGANPMFPCDGTTEGYDVVAIKTGSNWAVSKGGSEVFSGTDFQRVLTTAYSNLAAGRTSKQSILVQGDGEIPASAQVAIPSFTILNVCGTINVSGAPSGSDRSPFYARNAKQIEISNLKLTGSPQYGLFFRQSDDIHLGQIELRLTRMAGIGIRIDSGPNAQSTTAFNQNLTIDYVFGSGMGSHIVETYGIRDIKIGTVEGSDVGECGLLLNRSINAEIGLVSCRGCATGTGYAAFRVANSVGKVGNDFPPDNIRVGKVFARGGGRGIFSVSGSGGLTIDEIDLADTGNSPILLQNTYNTAIAAKSGTVSRGLVQLTNDTDNTRSGTYPPSKNVALKNLTLSNGASVRQDWCQEYGKNGSTATNITGGSVTMCP